MNEESLPACNGKCKMVETYKSINRSLSQQNSEMKEMLAAKEKENAGLRQLVLSLRTEIAENNKLGTLNDMIKVVAIATDAFSSITETIQNAGAKFAGFNNKAMELVQTGALDATVSNVTQARTPVQNKTAISRVNPIIRTPNGLMQTVSISLPRIDHSTLWTAAEQSTAGVSENGHSSISSNENTIVSENGENPEVPLDELNPTVNMIPDAIRDAPSTSTATLPRYTSESEFHGFADTEIDNRPNPVVIPQTQSPNDSYDYEGLSVIQEVTEIDYSTNNLPNNHITTDDHDDDASSGGEEIVRTTRRTAANKENTLRSKNLSIAQASCSTPMTPHRPIQRSPIKVAKVVLQQLNMDEVAATHPHIRSRKDSESSEETTVTTRKKTSGRKRKDSEMSEESHEGESDYQSGRPKRRATPVSFKEPTLREKLRRPK